jgi:hypothetical protein
MTAVPANAAVVFSDNFESPVASTTYTVANTSGQIDTTKWVRSSSGFNASRNGIVSDLRTGETFNDPTGAQAWAGRYSSNTGLTSAFPQIGTLAVGQTITVSFDSRVDSFNSGSAIYAMLVLFDGAGTRNSVENPLNNTFAVLDLFTATATGSYVNYSFSYTVGDTVVDNNGATAGVGTAWNSNALGKDIAIRFAHRNGALVDNVSVDISAIPEPSAALLGALGLLALLRRRR